MKITKKLAAVAISTLMMFSIAGMNVFAASTTQDGLEVSLTTDKEAYTKDEKITATLSVKNTNASDVTDVSLETLIPDGYEIDDNSANTKRLDKLAPNETAELSVVYVSKSSEISQVSEDSEISKISQVSEISEISQVSEVGKISQTSKTSPENANNVQTGDNSVVTAMFVVVLLIASFAIVIIAFRRKKGINFLSLILTVSLVGGLVTISYVNVDATSQPLSKNIKISSPFKIDNLNATISAIISYNIDSELPANNEKYRVNLVPSYGGTVKEIDSEYIADSNIEIEAKPDEGWLFNGWETTNGGKFDDKQASSTIFTMPNNDTTVIAKFIQEGTSGLSSDESDVYDAYYGVKIGFFAGDYEDSVTNNIVLPSNYGTDDHLVEISWTSSDVNVISTDGDVNRQSQDQYIVMKAIFKKGQIIHEKNYNLKVIKKSIYSDVSEIKDNTVMDLENLNQDAEYPIDILYDDTQARVKSILGIYSEIKVDSIDSAMNSIYSVRSLLGLSNPNEELLWESTNHSEVSLSYSFSQVYGGIPVYGRTLTVGADSKNGETHSLNSSILPEIAFENLAPSPKMTIDSIKAKYENEFFVTDYYTTIYSLNEYETNPIFAYVITSESEVIIVSADSGKIILRYPLDQDLGIYSSTGSGRDELDNIVTFPVRFYLFDKWLYYQDDAERSIHLNGNITDGWSRAFNCEWTDKTANSAYTNVIKVYDWYKSHLSRISIDNKGMDIVVNIHDYKNEKQTDNAHWETKNEEICFFENSGGGLPTTAAGLDIIAHEMTHGVFQKILSENHVTSFPYLGYTGAINEGYADVFGYFVDNGNWTIGEDWRTLRDLSNPEAYRAPSKLDGLYYYTGSNQSTLVHTNSSLVYHAAYLMHSYGITGEKLEKLWYDSMSAGYDATSDFYSVRRNLISAARNNHFSQKEMSIVRKAFDEEEIYDERGNISISFLDEDGNPMKSNLDASVSLQRNTEDAPQPWVFLDCDTIGTSGINGLYFGDYTLDVSVSGYKNYNALVKISTGKTNNIVIPLVREGDGSISGTITSATSGYSIESVTMKVFSGWNKKSGTVIKSTTTDENGKYKLALPAGYYTVAVSKDGYTTAYFNVSISGGKNLTNQNQSISPIMKLTDNFRVVLTWGANPTDLDSHLFGSLEDGTSYHIYYHSKNGYDKSGNRIANLDVDDTTSYGPETTTFQATSTGNYDYYIDWYSGNGTWASSGGKIEVYNGSRLWKTFVVPNVDNNSGSWKVFSIRNGIFTEYNEIQEEDIYTS